MPRKLRAQSAPFTTARGLTTRAAAPPGAAARQTLDDLARSRAAEVAPQARFRAAKRPTENIERLARRGGLIPLLIDSIKAFLAEPTSEEAAMPPVRRRPVNSPVSTEFWCRSGERESRRLRSGVRTARPEQNIDLTARCIIAVSAS
ncbi:MAG: hypothetical protein KGM15_06930 [Pseudomonadota bacterium]|nr:hypothetical protein [Pseudomonadota bacterium]